MQHAILIGANFLNQIELHSVKDQVRKIISDMPEDRYNRKRKFIQFFIYSQ